MTKVPGGRKRFGITESQVLKVAILPESKDSLWCGGAGESSQVVGNVPLCIPLPHLESKIAT